MEPENAAMSRPKKQHYVSQLHLKHFVGSDPAGMIWTYDAEMRRAAPSLPKETGAESNFYAVQREDGTYDDRIENWLAGVENAASVAYEKLLCGEIPQAQERMDFATFVSSLFARSPATRRMSAQVIGATHHALMSTIAATPERFEAHVQRFEAENGPIDPDVRARLYDFARDTTRYSLAIHKDATLVALNASDDLQELFYDMGWSVLEASDQYLITSDSPVCRESPKESDRPVRGNGGFMNKKVAITMPLSPKRALLMRWTRDSRRGILPIDRSTSRHLNIIRAACAERFLYADRLDAGLHQLAQKYRHQGNKFQFGGPRDTAALPKITVRRK